jgi:hypothetical protein
MMGVVSGVTALCVRYSVAEAVDTDKQRRRVRMRHFRKVFIFSPDPIFLCGKLSLFRPGIHGYGKRVEQGIMYLTHRIVHSPVF